MEFEERPFKHIRSVDDAVHEMKKTYGRLQPQDIAALFAVLAVLPIGYIYVVTFVFSYFHGYLSDEWMIRVIPLTFVGLNVYLNLYKVVKVGPNGNTSGLPSVMKPGFHYCHSCQVNSPPRAYHCPVCEVCVLRRDHHCSFGAVCVGHFNQRYFVGAILNLLAVSTVCMVYNWKFIFEVLPNLRIVDGWFILLPHLAFVCRFVTLYQFLVLVAFSCSFTVVLFTLYLLSAQAFCIYRGQTRVEYLLDVHAYNCGLFENIRQALGKRWYLIAISPFIPSPLESNGISFRTHQMEDISKVTKYM